MGIADQPDLNVEKRLLCTIQKLNYQRFNGGQKIMIMVKPGARWINSLTDLILQNC
jgi:hypothetical protein